MAHIIAASDSGPRANKMIDSKVKSEYDNLILLCPSCHTEIDKAPQIFTQELIHNWKKNHKQRIVETIGIPKFDNRKEARNFLSGILRKNKIIFESLNPNLPYRENPEAEEAVVWKRKMVTQIIPNNQKILLFASINADLLSDDELNTIEVFRQHIDDLIERHLGDSLGIASRFPLKMNDLLKPLL
ncbi:hypothetical protein ABIC74_000723 [Mucilaginibacter rubeus]|uniref:hypothetical protein n=1 Tax=Mucilaginibacter rubeus TaxID=2027860 RepID=UPI0033960301